MRLNQTRCFRCVGEIPNMIKYGKTKSGNQRYICRACGKTRVDNYAYHAYKLDLNQNIIQLVKEGLGIMYTISNLSLAAIDFTGALIFQIPMCHDFATKSGSVMYNIILIKKLCFYNSPNGTIFESFCKRS